MQSAVGLKFFNNFFVADNKKVLTFALPLIRETKTIFEKIGKPKSSKNTRWFIIFRSDESVTIEKTTGILNKLRLGREQMYF